MRMVEGLEPPWLWVMEVSFALLFLGCPRSHGSGIVGTLSPRVLDSGSRCDASLLCGALVGLVRVLSAAPCPRPLLSGQDGRTSPGPPRVGPRSLTEERTHSSGGRALRDPRITQLAPLLWGGPVARPLVSFPRFLSQANEWFLHRSFP